MAIQQYFVDPSIDADSGAGTVGDPWGDLQYALDNITQDTTDGDQINIKAGTDEVLVATLDFASYGAPNPAYRLTFRGYTSAANDGGIGGISGAGSYGIIIASLVSGWGFKDMHLHNCGSNYILHLSQWNIFENCEFDNTTSVGVFCSSNFNVHECYFHNIGNNGFWASSNGTVSHSIFENGTNVFGRAINAAHFTAINNIFKLSGTSIGIYSSRGAIFNNTIYSVAGTAAGIQLALDRHHYVYNNYIEGFSGVGGKAIEVNAGAIVDSIRSNRFYNVTDTITNSGIIEFQTDNNTLDNSALTNPGAGDFSVNADLKAGSYPTVFPEISTDQFMDIGAAQREEAGGGLLVHPGMSGGMRG